MDENMNTTSLEDELRRRREEEEARLREEQRLLQEKMQAAQDAANTDSKPGETNIGPSNRPFTKEQSDLLKERKAVRTTKTKAVKKGELTNLPSNLEPMREQLEKKNEDNEIISSSLHNWRTNREIQIDFSSIKDIDQAVYFAPTLDTEEDRKKYFKEYARRNNLKYEDVLAYADDKLGTKVFASPQSNAGKRNLMLKALDDLDLFDIAGEDVDVYSADFDVLAQSLTNIADKETREAGASYLESLTKIPGSPFYGRKFDKDDVYYRNNASLPENIYKKEIEGFGGKFYGGENAIKQDAETYLAMFEQIHALYGENPYAFRQMESALKDAYVKQTGYAAPKASALLSLIEERNAAGSSMEEEEEKGFWDWLFGNKKEEKPKAVSGNLVEGVDYTMREGYIASAGPAAGLLAENTQIREAVQAVADAPVAQPAQHEQSETPAQDAEQPAEASQPSGRWIDSRLDAHAEKAKRESQPMMSETEVLKYLKAGRGDELSEANYAQVKDVWENDTFRSLGLFGVTPTEKQLYDQGHVNGYPLTEEERLEYAFETTSAYQLLGKTLGGVADTLNSGAMPEDISLEGQLLLGDIIDQADRLVRSGNIHIPQNANKYEYAISQSPALQKKAEQLTALQARVNAIQANKAIEAAHDYDRKVDSAERAFISGRPLTQEQVMLLTENAKTISSDQIYNDKARRDMRFMLGDNSPVSYYKDDGKFWSGNSAAAEEGKRLLETQSVGKYDMYKYELREVAYEVIDDLANTAYGRGMTLEQFMTRTGIGIDQVMDMAYNRIAKQGAQIQNDSELQQIANDVTSGQVKSVGLGTALVYGSKHAAADNRYHFMNAPYAALDAFTYDERIRETYAEYDEKYKMLAAAMRRKDLIDYANSGEMPAEDAKALIEDVENASDIFDIAFEIDPGWLASSWREAMWEFKKDADALEAVAAEMPDYERAAFMGASNVVGNIEPMVYSAVIGGAATALRAPAFVARTLAAVPHSLPMFSRSYEDNSNAGLSSKTAAWMAFGETAIMSYIESFGAEKTIMDSFFGSALARDSMEATLRKTGTGAMNVIKAMARASALDYGAGEAGEEVVQTLAGAGLALFRPAILGVEQGTITTPGQFMGATLQELKATDPVELFKEAATGGTMGFVMGALVSLPVVGANAYKAVTNVNLQNRYKSIDMASQITHGEIPASDENIGRFIDAMREDSKDPKFISAYNKTADAAMQMESLAVSAMSGVGHDFRVLAVTESKKAADYEAKAEAAKKAVESNKKQYAIACANAANGNKGAAVSMEGFRTAWAKAQTTDTENKQAAAKAKEKAAEYTAKWLQECRKAASVFTRFTKQSAMKQMIDLYHNLEADDMEADVAQAEQNAAAMEAEEFIEKNYKNSSDADKDHIREIWGVPVGTKKEAAPQAATVAENAQVAQGEETSTTASQTASEAPEAQLAQTVTEQTQAPVQARTGEERLIENRKRRIKAAERFAGQVTRRFGVGTEIAPANDARLKLPAKDKNGNARYAPALYDRKADKIIISENATQGDVIRAKIVHELTHRTEGTEAYKEFAGAVLKAYYKTDENIKAARNARKSTYAGAGIKLDEAGIDSELVAYATEQLIGGDQEMIDRIVNDNPSVARRIMDAIKAVLDKLTGAKGKEIDELRAVEEMFKKALDDSMKRKKGEGVQHSTPDSVSPETGEILTGTVGGDTVVQYSLASWTPEEQNAVRSNLIANGYDEETVDDWIDDVNSIAAVVAADRDRLDFEAAKQHTMLKPNQEYVKTLDASTLCAKRRIYQGTFNAIQHILKNRVLSSDDLIRIRNMLAEMGYETPCGICYVESRRRNLGTFAKKWLDGYDAKGGYQPTLDDVTTSDGLDRMLKEHPEVYQSFLAEMNRKGSNNPKVVQTRTDYRGEIRDLTESQIKKIVDIGGLRVQSFSDFETPHLLDMMQAVLDMTNKGLTSQAYTKFPNFAWVFGDTGIKINLSLIAEGNGLDANGNLIFSSYEGMDFDEAMRLRNRYSQNVGTILVGLSDAHIRAAMADNRIDFIIPFHKSGWGKRQLSQISGMSGYMDYTRDQNERRVIGVTRTGKPKTKNVEENFHPVGPSGYWQFEKSGDENAEIYLRKCEADGRIPKFSRFLSKDADGHWVAPSGYWKLLIDFKMYDNDGVGAPQMPVKPNFNMTEAMRVLDEYEGGADTLPVARDVVERFVAEKTGKSGVQYAIDEPNLPDDDNLRAEIDAWRSNPNYSAEDENVGKRQFANRTLQNNQYIPDYIKQEFLNNPAKSDYSKESNMSMLNTAWNSVQAVGYEAARDRLVNQETKFDAYDNAVALLLMRQALHDGDLDTLMAVATKYNAEGTDQAKALQIRNLMRKMTPTGFAQTVIQDVSRKVEDRDTKKPGEYRKRKRESEKVKEDLNLGSMDATSAAEALGRGESVVIDSKYGASLNEAKRALIKEFGLEKTTRPGDFYNWATTKQRMLEDILTTDDIWAKDSYGMDLVDRLVRMKHGDIVLTKADLEYIMDQMAAFDRLTDKNSREADLALARAHEAQGNINGATGKMKRRTWRYVSMLLSAPSAIRNVIGNVAQSVPNAIADGIAVEFDRILSGKTDERTRAHLDTADRIKGWAAFREETFNTFRDYFVDKTITQHGEGRYNQSQIGRVYQTQGLETLRHLEGLLMSVGDRTFWKKKFLNSMAEQQHLAEINGTAFDVEAAMDIAEAEANYATFNEDSAVRSLMSAMTEQIPFLDYLMPFVGVPTNIIKRQIEFSPIGIATTAFRHGLASIRGEAFDQRAFVDGMARGLTGSAMMMAGIALFKAGVLNLGTKEEDDDKSYGIRTAQGDQYGVYFTIGDKNYSITTFSPAASALVAGAFAADAMQENDNWVMATLNGMTKNINEIFDASYMSALGDVLNTSNGKSVTDNVIPAIASAMVTQNIPAPLTHLASSLDPYVRDTKDKDALMEVLKTTINKIPGARTMLPEKVDVAGRAVENTKFGVAAFIDPFTTSYVSDDPALSEMIRLRDALVKADDPNPRAHMASDALSGRRNTLTQNKVTYTVTGEEKEAFRKRYGDLWRNGGNTYDKSGRKIAVQGVEELITSRYYQLMSDKEKAKAIQEIINAAKAGATYETMNHK